jgi:hypothetical protein
LPGAFATQPAPERPTTPDRGYGVPAAGGEMIDWASCVDRLRTANAYWLATVSPNRRPRVVPVWGVMVDDALYLETGAPNTAKVRDIAVNDAIAIHLDGVNDALILHGRAVLARPNSALGLALAAAFKQKYTTYAPSPHDWDEGGLHKVVPTVMLAWREMPTATRWRFPHQG